MHVVAARYVVGNVIGKGGAGTVFAARDNATRRRVALKILHARLAGNVEATVRFLREAETARSFSGPHAVTVHDAGRADDGRPFYVFGVNYSCRLTTTTFADRSQG